MTIISQGSGNWFHPYGQPAPWGPGLSHGQYFTPLIRLVGYTCCWIHDWK